MACADNITEDRVILRRFRGTGELIALFPDIDEGHGRCASYMRVGQHSPASRQIIDATTLADAGDDDAVALLAELRQVGYLPRVIRRWPARAR